jgi:hypothetical protein
MSYDKIEILFFFLRMPLKHNFPRRTIGLAEEVTYFTNIEMNLLTRIVVWHKLFLNAKRIMLYHTTCTRTEL